MSDKFPIGPLRLRQLSCEDFFKIKIGDEIFYTAQYKEQKPTAPLDFGVSYRITDKLILLRSNAKTIWRESSRQEPPQSALRDIPKQEMHIFHLQVEGNKNLEIGNFSILPKKFL